MQFELNNECLKAIKNTNVRIEENMYDLVCQPTVAVSTDEKNACTLMIRLDSTVRLWDKKILFKDKNNWKVIEKIKQIMRKYGGEAFVDAMDINGDNLLVKNTPLLKAKEF